MSVFVDVKDIIAVVVILLAILSLGCFFLWGKITEWRKRRARKLLANDDIARYERQIKKLEHYGEIVEDMRRREAILCPTLLSSIVEMLPDPNLLTRRGGGVVLQGHPVKLYIAGRGNFEFSLDFIADKDDAPTGEKGLTVRVSPTGQEVRFTLKLQNRRQYIQGVEVQVNSWYWDLRFSGIQMLSDEGFGRIIDFVLSSRLVNDAFGMNGAKCIGEL